MTWAELAGGVFFAITGLGCVLLTTIGLPGTWLLVALAGLTLSLGQFWPTLTCASPGTGLVILGAVLALGGEVLESLAGAAGSRAGGGSGRGMIGALIGGIAGGLLLTGLIPIPLVGTLVGAIAGTFVGAFVAEFTTPVPPGVQAGLRAAAGATLGRLAGTFGKALVAVVIAGVFTIGAVTACPETSLP